MTAARHCERSNVGAFPYADFTASEALFAACPVDQVKNIVKEVRWHGARRRGGVGDPVDR